MKKQKKLIEDDANDLDLNPEIEDIESKNVELEEFEVNPNLDYRSLQSTVTYEDEEYLHSVKLNDKIDEIFLK